MIFLLCSTFDNFHKSVIFYDNYAFFDSVSLDNAVFDNSAPGFRCELETDNLGEDGYFIGRLRGFYVPPRDGYYAFSIICDDRSYLFLSSSNREEDKVKSSLPLKGIV